MLCSTLSKKINSRKYIYDLPNLFSGQYVVPKKMFIEFAIHKTSHQGILHLLSKDKNLENNIQVWSQSHGLSKYIPSPEKQVLASDSLCDLEDFTLISRNCVILRLKPFLFQIALSCTPGMMKMPEVISSTPKD